MTNLDNGNLPIDGEQLPSSNPIIESALADTTSAEVPAVKTASLPETKWFVLRVVSGKERKIKEYLDNEIKRSQWEKHIIQVMCPVEKVVKVVGGKKTIREKIMYPGYLLLESVNSKLNDEILQEIKNTTNVIHFLGKENPTALRKNEVSKMFGKLDEMSELGVKLNDPFIFGEAVKIIDGPFNDFLGTVDEVDEDKKKVKVVVKIFGKDTPVELSFFQVEKMS